MANQCPAGGPAQATFMHFTNLVQGVDVMMQTIHAHPTLYEAMGEAFNAVYGLSINA